VIRRPPYCADCGAEITWSETETGKRMPVDRTSTSDGNVVYIAGEVHVLKQGEILGGDVPRYKAHFATCTRRKTDAP